MGSKIEATFDWEDAGQGQLRSFTCSCGYKVSYGDAAYDKTVSEDDVVECPSCKRKYRCVWYGMALEEVR